MSASRSARGRPLEARGRTLGEWVDDVHEPGAAHPAHPAPANVHGS